jgi:hypothetical protein
MNTSGEPDELETLMSGSVGGTRKPTVVIRQGGGCLPYDVSVIYLFVDGSYVGEAYCPAFMGQRVSEWEAKAMRKADAKGAKDAGEKVVAVRAQIQEDIETTKKQRTKALRQAEKARQYDRQREEIHPSAVVLTTVYNCARIKLTAPRDGCKLWSMRFIIPAGGSHDQEQDSEVRRIGAG